MLRIIPELPAVVASPPASDRTPGRKLKVWLGGSLTLAHCVGMAASAQRPAEQFCLGVT